MPRGKLTPKQAEIKSLLGINQSIVQIAELMDTTPGAVKAQISRMRKNGHSIPRVAAAVAAPTPSRTVDKTSVEAHIDGELTAVDERLATIDETMHSLNGEHRDLSERRERLRKAWEALTPETSKPQLAAVS